MEQSSRWNSRAPALAVVLILVAACGGPAQSPGPGATGTAGSPGTGSPGTGSPGEQLGGSVSVLAQWTGAEEESFRAMVQPWIDRTGVDLQYTGTRSQQDQLTQAISAGGTGLPDVAGIPGPGLAADWFRAGALLPLDFIDLEAYRESSALADIGVIDDTLVGVFTKAAVKGLIWYDKDNYDGTVPATWADLAAIDPAPAEALWCNAWESGDTSGWPGTDWIEDFIIRQSGPEFYDSWVAGQATWTSAEVRAAFEALSEVVKASYQGGTYINATDFRNVGEGLFSDPPGCKFIHQASFIAGEGFVDISGAEPTDFDFFVMPDVNSEFAGALTGGGDMFGMFHDTPQARSLIEYLLTPEAQAIWAGRGGFIAANKNVPADAYSTPSDQKAGEAVARATALRFDASDLMPGAMGSAFNRALVELAKNPDDIDTILADLDTVQADAYSGAASPSP